MHIPKELRRLTVGYASEESQVSSTWVSEEDRGVVTKLVDEDIMVIMGKNHGETSGTGSCEDGALASFGEKKSKSTGGEFSPEKHVLGHACRKGLKPESPNQDSWCILNIWKRFAIYGVFDGHGREGHKLSIFVKDTLPKLMIKDQRWNTDELHSLLRDVFMETQRLVRVADHMQLFNAQMSGTTASIAIHDHERKMLTIAHVADSTVVLGRYTSKHQRSKDDMEAITLTRDHKPNIKSERERIEKSGGRVIFDGYKNHRVYDDEGTYPGLNMSRCIGDLMGHEDCGISAEPEVSERPITEEDHVLLLCSDGIWEFIKPGEAVKIVSGFSPAEAMTAADALAKAAQSRWLQAERGDVVDDITVIIAYLNQNHLESVCSKV